MAAIQHRDREQVDQTKVDGQHRDKRHQAGYAKLSDLSGQLRDPERATEFFGAAGTGNHLGQAGEGFLRDGPGLRHTTKKGSRDADVPVFNRATTDAQQDQPDGRRTLAIRVVTSSCWSAPSRRMVIFSVSPGCMVTECCRSSNVAIESPAMETMRSLTIRPARDAALSGSTAPTTGNATGSPIAMNSAANSTIASKNSHRTRRDNNRARQHGLVVEGLARDPVGADVCLQRPADAPGHATSRSRQRQPRELPDCAAAIGPGCNRPAEADGERLDPDTPPTRRQVVTEFMHKDEHAEHDDERAALRMKSGIKFSTMLAFGSEGSSGYRLAIKLLATRRAVASSAMTSSSVSIFELPSRKSTRSTVRRNL